MNYDPALAYTACEIIAGALVLLIVLAVDYWRETQAHQRADAARRKHFNDRDRE